MHDPSLSQTSQARIDATASHSCRMSRILSTSQQSIGPSSPIDAPVIFLDVDGVLNTNATSRAHHEVIECDAEQSRRVDAALVRRLVDVVRVTRARIVLSSAWRLRFDSKHGLVAAFEGLGLDPSTFIGQTGSQPTKRRTAEILAWLRDHGSTDAATASWVAVDDIDLLGESPAEMRGHVIQTSLGERQERSRGA